MQVQRGVPERDRARLSHPQAGHPGDVEGAPGRNGMRRLQVSTLIPLHTSFSLYLYSKLQDFDFVH